MRFLALLPLLTFAACADGDTADGEDTDTDAADTDTDATDSDTDVAATAQCAEVGTICTIAGKPGLAAFGAEGVLATDSELYLPIDGTVGPDGLLYLIDYNNHRLRRIDRDGTIHSFAGTGFLGDGPEGDARFAAFNHPTNLLFHPDDATRLTVAAWHNSRIEDVALTTNTVSFVAGTGARSYGGDGGAPKDAALDLPAGIAYDDDASLLISDSANMIIRRIRDGVITTIAGTAPTISATPVGACGTPPCTVRAAGWSGDEGPATAARFNFPSGQKGYPGARILRVDRKLYVADSLNHVVRYVDLDAGTVHHVAGTGAVAGTAGDGGLATAGQLNFPTDVEVDAEGNLYIADTENSCVRKVDTAGVLSTFAGVCGEFGYGGDGGPAAEARLAKPYGLAYDPAGFLIIADTENHVFRRVAL